MIPQMEPLFGEEEAKAVYQYVQGGAWLTEYKKTAQLEEILAAYLNVRHVIMVTSGTMALYAALSVLDMGPGDHVLVPGMTMIATANAVTMTGAYPVFVDISPRTLCMEPYDHVDRYAKAMIYVSLNGRCGDMDEVRSFCKRNNLWLIEDAAQSLGSAWNGQSLGTFGDIGCFSLSCQKIISTGNGGFCTTNSTNIAQKLRMFKDFGRTKGGQDEYLSFGVNLKFTDLQAVIGIEQMKKLPARVERKKAIWDRYCDRLYGIKGVEIIPTSSETAPWFVDIFVEDRDDLSAYLGTLGIGTRPFYPALHKTAVYNTPIFLPVCEDVSQRGLWLPSSSHLTNEEVDRVCDEIEAFYE